MLNIIKKRIGIDRPDDDGYFDDDRIEDAWTVLWNYSGFFSSGFYNSF